MTVPPFVGVRPVTMRLIGQRAQDKYCNSAQYCCVRMVLVLADCTAWTGVTLREVCTCAWRITPLYSLSLNTTHCCHYLQKKSNKKGPQIQQTKKKSIFLSRFTNYSCVRVIVKASAMAGTTEAIVNSEKSNPLQ